MEVRDCLHVYQLGCRPYQDVLDEMHQFTQNRNPHTVDQFWLVEHPPVFTQGQAGKVEHLLQSTHIPVMQSDRGGQITYHGPGQLVVYLLVDLRRRKYTVRALVDAIEQSVVRLLSLYQVQAYAKPKAPGVYVEQAKIAALGLRIRRGCSFHGVALNVAMDLSPFKLINPCGYAGLKVTQCTDVGGPATLEETAQKLVPLLAEQIGYTVIDYYE